MGKSVGSYFWRTKKEILLTTKFENVTIILSTALPRYRIHCLPTYLITYSCACFTNL